MEMEMDMNMELDRISNLPSDLIVKILLHLPLREAARTSVLSRRWRYESAKLPHLVFDDVRFWTLDPTTFVDMVYDVLFRHIGSIHKFLLFCIPCLPSQDLDRWICYVSKNSIKELVLVTCYHYEIHPCLFSCQDMIHLDLTSCLLKPPSTFKGFRNLKILHLAHVILAQDVFENLIQCSPMLEVLDVENCDGLTHLKIDSPNLRRLTCFGDFQDVNFKNTLKLDVLDISLDQVVWVPSSSSNLVKFFAQLPGIQDLTMHGDFLKYLAVGGSPRKLPNPCLHLTGLYMHMFFTDCALILTALCILRSCPALQEVVIYVRGDLTDVSEETNFCFDSLDDNQDFGFTQLRLVNIFCFSGIKVVQDFIKLMLSSSPVLKKMVVHGVFSSVSLEREKLLQFRASEHAEIIFSEDEGDE